MFSQHPRRADLGDAGAPLGSSRGVLYVWPHEALLSDISLSPLRNLRIACWRGGHATERRTRLQR